MKDLNVEKKFLEAYDSYAEAIFRHCYFRVYSKARAEELMQETFMKTWQELSKGVLIENIRAFLYKVATNLIIDESRKKKEVSLEAGLENATLVEPTTASKAENETELTMVLDVMKQLKDEDREVLTLRYVNDLDPQDIAKIWNVSANTVSVRIHRAIARLKEALGRHTLKND